MNNKNQNVKLDQRLILLFIGQSISSIGNSFTGMVITWFIISTGTPLQFGIRIALSFIPNVLLAPIAGSIVDKISRKKLVWSSDILRLVLDVFLIYIIYIGYFNITVIYGYTLLQALVRLVFEPAKRSMIQKLTIDEQRVRANALNDMFMRVGMVIGPALAGLAVKNLSKIAVITIDGITFLIAALIVLFIKYEDPEIKANAKRNHYANIVEGWHYVKKHTWILYLSLAFCFCNAGNMLASVSRSFFLKQVLNLGADYLGYLSSIGAIGGIAVGYLLMNVKLKRHKLTYGMYSTVIWAVGTALLYFTPNFTYMAVVCFIAFATGPAMAISSNAFYQQEIAPEYMGRVFAVRSMISSFGSPIGALTGALFIKIFGIRGSFIVSGISILLCSILMFVARSIHTKNKQTSIAVEIKTQDFS